VSELQWVHLLEAHSAELLVECHRSRLYLAVFGEELTAEDLPAVDYEPGSELEDVYCLECIRAASRHNDEVGVSVEVGCGDDVRGYFIGQCGHPAPIGASIRVGECRICDISRSTVPDLRLPASELYSIKMASVEAVSWWCRLCDHDATAASAPGADTAAVEHLAACHHAVLTST
jgi:hypothetical protein